MADRLTGYSCTRLKKKKRKEEEGRGVEKEFIRRVTCREAAKRKKKNCSLSLIRINIKRDDNCDA